MTPFRSEKNTNLGGRVPGPVQVVRWPGKIIAGSNFSNEMVSGQ